MKTHELAKALNHLAKLLRACPNTELSDFELPNANRQREFDNNDIPAALSMLAALSNFNKKQWTDIINEYELDVEIKKTDSVRDLLGRLLKHLADNKDARTQLAEKAKKGTAKTSPELAEALSILLR